MLKFIFILVSINGIFRYSEAICNQCNLNNGVACISNTEFHICADDVPVRSKTFSCLNPNEICTKHGAVCMDASLIEGLTPACGDISNCGACQDINDGGYTCTSRTTYTMCFDATLTDIRMSCPQNQMCDSTIAAEGTYPCVPECKEPEIKFCDLKEAIDVPVTTTAAPTTTTEVTTPKTETPSTTTTTVEITTTTEETTTTTEETTTTTEEITTTTEEITTTTKIFSPTPTTVTTTTEAPTPSTPLSTTTTTEPPTTPTTENPANNVCSQQTAVGRYPYPNDTTCRNYVYCFRKGGVMQTTFYTCPQQFYFNASTRQCGELKPQGCI